MKFSQSLKKSSFDEPKNYFPNPQYYQNKSQLPPKEFKMTFGQAQRFETKSMDSSPMQQYQGMSPKNSNLKIQDIIQLYQRNKRGVFKSTFKNIKNSIELSPEYGEGLMKIMQQYDNKLKLDSQTPGPAEYNPSFSVVSRRVQSQIIQPSLDQSSSPRFNNQNTDSLQILVENRVPKIGLLPKIERDRLQEVKAYQIRQPKHGVLRKAKIAKNIFDQAKDDEFDPSPESSSIELFLLRQKLLGPDEIPPPGHYFDPEKCSSFQLKKNSSVNIHFDSTEQRVMTFGNTVTNHSEDDDSDEDGQQTSHEGKRKSYFSQASVDATNTQESLPVAHGNLTAQTQFSQTKQKTNHIDTSMRNKHTSKQFYTRISFSKCKKVSFFDTFKNQYPGPGSYAADYNESLKRIDEFKNKPDLYFKPSFGSGCKRFLDIKTVES